MNDHARQSISIRMPTATLPAYPSLTIDEHADICIVGAGIAGLTTSCLLGRARGGQGEHTEPQSPPLPFARNAL